VGLLEELERQAPVEGALVVPAAATVDGARGVAVGTPARTMLETAEATHVAWSGRATAGRTGVRDGVRGRIAARGGRTAAGAVLPRRPHV
jgi:hypothetical protein